MSDRASSWFDRLLIRLDIEPTGYRALLNAYLLMDFRNQQFGRATATGGAKEILTPLFTVTGQNLLIGLFVSVALFARVDAFFFALVALGVSMIVTASSVVVEFNEIVLDPEDLHVIGHRPIPARTYAAARVTNLLFYVLLTSAGLSFCPAIVGAGLRDVDAAFFPLFATAALAGNSLAAGGIILFYNLWLGSHPTTQVREALAWVQVGAMLLFGYGAQLVIRDPGQSLQMLAYDLPEWVARSPLGWVPAAVAGGEATNWPSRLGSVAAASVAALAVWGVVVRRLAAVYAELEPGGAGVGRTKLPRLPAPGELAGALVRGCTRPGEERAAYWLARTFLSRDYALKMRCWTSHAIVLAVLALGWLTGRLVDPLQVHDQQSMFTLACLYLVAMPLPQVMYNLNFSKDHQASWVLSTAPIEDAAGFASGLRKAVVGRFSAPLLVLLFVVLAATWRDVGHAAVQIWCAGCAVWLAAHASSAGAVRATPFAAPLARGESFGPIAPLAAVVGTVVSGLALLHWFAARDSATFTCFTIAITVAAALAGRVTGPLLVRRSLPRAGA